jgi:hypothetical protein
LIVPVWNDEELVVDLVSGLQAAPELVEWVANDHCSALKKRYPLE